MVNDKWLDTEFHNLEEFRTSRPEHYENGSEIYMESLVRHQGFVAFSAPVKSGKNGDLQAFSLLASNAGHKVFFFTAHNRVDSKEQYKEHELYGINCFTLANEKELEKAKIAILNSRKIGKDAVACFDEFDFGSGSKMLLGKLYGILMELKIPVIGFSATPQEAIFSNPTKIIIAKVAPEYVWTDHWLDNNLIHLPGHFLENEECTKYGLNMIEWASEEMSKDNEKEFCMVTFPINSKSNKTRSIDALMHQFRTETGKGFKQLDQRNVQPIFVTEKNPFNWGFGKYSNTGILGFEDFIDNGKLKLICTVQTCTRSTKISFHKHLSFSHDYRIAEKTNFTTLLQKDCRILHYRPKTMPQGYFIRSYSDRSVFELETKKNYTNYPGRISQRIKTKEIMEYPDYSIRTETYPFDPGHHPTRDELRKAAKIIYTRLGISNETSIRIENFKEENGIWLDNPTGQEVATARKMDLADFEKHKKQGFDQRTKSRWHIFYDGDKCVLARVSWDGISNKIKNMEHKTTNDSMISNYV